MKGLIRSKLTQTLAVLVMIAVAIVVPLSGNSLYSHAAPSSSQASWNIVPSPTPSGGGFLTSTAAVSSNDVWAVGNDYNNGAYYKTLTEHWDGTSWTIKPSPNAGSSTNQLLGIAAVSSNDVWAVGNYTDSAIGYQQTLILHWDGSIWNIVSSPNASSYSNYLNSVAAVSATDVWAVGEYIDSSDNGQTLNGHTLVEHWDGSSWSVVSSPSGGGAHANFLESITAVSATDIWAVGAKSDYALGQTLIEHYDGTSWTVVSSPNVCTGSVCDQYLLGVSAISSNDVWAVGDYHTFYTGDHTSMTMHWDGTSWTMVSSPNVPNTQATGLTSVTAISSSDVWAIGYSNDNTNGNQAVAMHYDGSNWNISSNSSFSNITLFGAAAVATNDVWAVGQGSSGTLTEHYTDSSPTPTDTPIPTPTDSPTPTPSPTPTLEGNPSPSSPLVTTSDSTVAVQTDVSCSSSISQEEVIGLFPSQTQVSFSAFLTYPIGASNIDSNETAEKESLQVFDTAGHITPVIAPFSQLKNQPRFTVPANDQLIACIQGADGDEVGLIAFSTSNPTLDRLESFITLLTNTVQCTGALGLAGTLGLSGTQVLIDISQKNYAKAAIELGVLPIRYADCVEAVINAVAPMGEENLIACLTGNTPIDKLCRNTLSADLAKILPRFFVF